jgi:hypothetical protein
VSGVTNMPSYSATTEYPGERSECLGFNVQHKSGLRYMDPRSGSGMTCAE